MITLENITLGQYQELQGIWSLDIDDLDKMTELVAFISGKTFKEVEDLTELEVKRLSKEVRDILSAPIPEGEPKKELAGVGICYEPGKLTRGQYVTFMHFMKDPLVNCHYLMASLSYNLKTKKHESDKHSEIADKLQEVPFKDIYPSCLFFCQLFTHSIKGLGDYLMPILMETMTRKEAKETLTVLMNGLVGCMPQRESLSLRA